MSEKIQAYLSAKFVGGLARKEASTLANYVQMAIAEIECYSTDPHSDMTYLGLNPGKNPGISQGSDQVRVLVSRKTPNKPTHYADYPGPYDVFCTCVFWVIGTEIHAVEAYVDHLTTVVVYPEPYVGEYSEDLLLWIIRCLLGEVKP